MHLQLFGYPTIFLHDKRVTGFVTDKTLALLIYVAATEQTHARDYLAGLFWGDSAENKAKASLRSALYKLGQLLPGYLSITRKAVALNPEHVVTSDIAQFETGTVGDDNQLRAALALYRDDFLAGFYINDVPEFESWLLTERERLRSLAVAGWERLARHDAAQGAWAASEQAWRQLVVLEPWREEPHRHLLHALARQGKYDNALRHYAVLREQLKAELGVEPMPKTRQLMAQIALARSAPRHNLPAQQTPFFGRSQTLNLINTLLSDHAMITVTGLGGSGKTRLALEIGRTQQHRFLNGVVFVSLVALAANSPAQAVAEAVVQAMTEADMLAISTYTDSERFLAASLAKRDLLLILDNFEHVLAAAPLLDRLCRAAPQLRMVITSRERLQLHQERVILIPPLHEADAPQSPAVQLFIDAARRIQPTFAPADQIADITRIIDLVGGMPLAIELAAGWVGMQSCAAIAQQLQVGIDLLASEERNRPNRHRTIHAVLEQAWQQISAEQQTILKRLAVFTAPFTPAAAWEIADATLPLLRTLQNRTLIQAAEHRLALHPLMRQFLLLKSADNAPLHERHARYYLRHFQEISALTPNFRHNLEHITVAWQWASANDLAAIEPLISHLRNNFGDCGVDNWRFDLIQRALAAVKKQGLLHLQIKLELDVAYALFWNRNQSERALQLLEHNYALLQTRDSPEDLGWCCAQLGWYHEYHTHEYERANAYHLSAIEAYHAGGHARFEATRTVDLGNLAFELKNYAEAERYWQSAHAIFLQLEDAIGIGCAIYSLARVSMVTGDLAETHRRLKQAQQFVQYHLGLHQEVERLLGYLAALENNQHAAEAHLQKQLQLTLDEGRSEVIVEGYCALGMWARYVGCSTDADRYFDLAWQWSQRSDRPQLAAQIEAAKVLAFTPENLA